MLNKKFILNNLISDHLKSLINILKDMGANIIIDKNSITVNQNKELIGAKIQAAPYRFSNRSPSTNDGSNVYC